MAAAGTGRAGTARRRQGVPGPAGGAGAAGGGAERRGARAAPAGLEEAVAAQVRSVSALSRGGGGSAPRPSVARGGAGGEFCRGSEGRVRERGRAGGQVGARSGAGGGQPAALCWGGARALRAEFQAEFQVLVRAGCLDTRGETAVSAARGVRPLPLASWDRGTAFEGAWGTQPRSSTGGRVLPKMLLKAGQKYGKVNCTRLNLGGIQPPEGNRM